MKELSAEVEGGGPRHVTTLAVGDLRVHAIQTGGIRLDGGAMFGVVPKPLWERRMPPDSRNRIQMGMRCLLVEHPSALVLIDSGLGNKEGDRFMDIYGVENGGRNGRTLLEDGLEALNVRPADIDMVINTHLHFDHGGGNTFRDVDGEIRLTFAGARHVVQARELEFATHTNERTAASYLPHNIEPLVRAEVLELVDGEGEILPGVRVIPTPGHVPGHQSVLLQSGGETLVYLGDLVPTAAHLPLPWIMGYDVEPLVTLESRRELLGRAERENWILAFEHDWQVPWGRLAHDGKSYVLAPL